MPVSSFDDRRRLTHLDRAALAELQLQKLNRLLTVVLAENELYRRKLAGSSGAAEKSRRACTAPAHHEGRIAASSW